MNKAQRHKVAKAQRNNKKTLIFKENYQNFSTSSRQSIPILGFESAICFAFASATVSIGPSPLFSAKAVGITSSASAKALTAYCSTVEI